MALRALREERGYSQEELAERAKLDRTYISGIERGVRNPTLLSSLRIAKALGTTVCELYKDVKP